MIDKPHLIIVSPGFPANKEDTTCLPAFRMFVNEVKALNKFTISIVTLQYPYTTNEYDWFGTKVYPVGGKNKKGFLRLKTFINTYFLLKKLNQKNLDTIVFSFFATDAAFVASYFCKINNLKHYCWLIGQDVLKKNKYMPLIARETLFIAMSDFIKKTAETNFKIKVRAILQNGLNLNNIPVFEKTQKTNDFICVGSLIKLKRTEWIIKLIHDLSKENIYANCIIIGDGPEKKFLQNEIIKFNLQDRIKLIGILPHEEVIKVMFKSKLFIHPSSYEGFSTVCIEALYAACHVVTTCNPLSEENEQMHAVNNYEELYFTSKQLLNSPLTFKSYTDYTTTKTAQKFIDLLQTLN